MNTLDQIRNNLTRAWDTVTEGWHQLSDTARNALTRFNPITQKDNVQTPGDIAMIRGSRWGLLAADVEEDDNTVTVRLEAPGMEAGDFDIAVQQNHLLVRGEKHAKREQTSGQYLITECAYGAFSRAVPLPVQVDEEKAKAKYKRGVLTVTLPKIETHQRRRIEVKS